MVFDYSHQLKGLDLYRVAGTSNWTKLEQRLVAKGTNRTSRLQITTNKKGVIWFDQVSLIPADTYKVCYIIFLWAPYIILWLNTLILKERKRPSKVKTM